MRVTPSFLLTRKRTGPRPQPPPSPLFQLGTFRALPQHPLQVLLCRSVTSWGSPLRWSLRCSSFAECSHSAEGWHGSGGGSSPNVALDMWGTLRLAELEEKRQGGEETLASRLIQFSARRVLLPTIAPNAALSGRTWTSLASRSPPPPQRPRPAHHRGRCLLRRRLLRRRQRRLQELKGRSTTGRRLR